MIQTRDLLCNQKSDSQKNFYPYYQHIFWKSVWWTNLYELTCESKMWASRGNCCSFTVWFAFLIVYCKFHCHLQSNWWIHNHDCPPLCKLSPSRNRMWKTLHCFDLGDDCSPTVQNWAPVETACGNAALFWFGWWLLPHCANWAPVETACGNAALFWFGWWLLPHCANWAPVETACGKRCTVLIWVMIAPPLCKLSPSRNRMWKRCTVLIWVMIAPPLCKLSPSRNRMWKRCTVLIWVMIAPPLCKLSPSRNRMWKRCTVLIWVMIAPPTVHKIIRLRKLISCENIVFSWKIDPNE